ncbi:MAG: WGR domain-containing protein [bacterium]|nr:WGR domain-containing protein [bacterium]
MKLVKQTTLHFQDEKSDKIYEVDLCEVGDDKYVVNFRYGKRGSSLKDGTKTVIPVDGENAEAAFIKLVESKVKKGYKSIDPGAAAPDLPPAEQIEDANMEIEDTTGLTPREKVILERLAEEPPPKPEKTKKTFFKRKQTESEPVEEEGWPLSRVIWRAGELAIREAEPLLLNLLGSGDDLRDYCIVRALGTCGTGEGETLERLKQEYNNTATSPMVRRMTAEALLRLLPDAEVKTFREGFIAALPEKLKKAVSGPADEFSVLVLEYLEKAALEKFSLLTDLYLINSETARAALIEVLKTAPMKPNYFKQIRHIFKAAEYRLDAEIFSLIAYRFETSRAMFDSDTYSHYIHDKNGNYKYVRRSELKKHLQMPDAKLAYGSGTRLYFRRRVWRTLRQLAELRDPAYVSMAAAVLAQVSDKNGGKPRTSIQSRWYRDESGRWRSSDTETHYDSFAGFWAFCYILYKNSPRYFPLGKTWRCREEYKPGDPAPAEREEAYPELWDKQYPVVAELLEKSKAAPVHNFGVKVLRDSEEFMSSPSQDLVIKLLGCPYDITAELGLELALVLCKEDPDVSIIRALTSCVLGAGRHQAFTWIKEKKELFMDDETFLLDLVTSPYADTRIFARSFLKENRLPEEKARTLFTRIMAHLLTLKKNNADIIRDMGETLLTVFPAQSGTLGMEVINDCINSPVKEIQETGSKILLAHETYGKNPPQDIIKVLLSSQFGEIRGLGVTLFGQLPDETLLDNPETLVRFITHKDPEMSNAVRPIVKRLALSNELFGREIVPQLIEKLFRFKDEEILKRVTVLIKEDLRGITSVPLATIRRLLRAKSGVNRELGGIFLTDAEDRENLTVEEVVTLADHDVYIVRKVAWQLCESKLALFKKEIVSTVRMLDAEWDDSREFAFNYVRNNFSDEDFTPASLVMICDSIREEVRSFGRELVTRFFKDEQGEEYLLKLSEHPSKDVQLFVTNYLERFAADNPAHIKQLGSYFKQVLCGVNKGRTAKKRILLFLEQEALKNFEAAFIIAEILTFVSGTIAVEYKAAAIQAMVKIRRAWPDIPLPIETKSVEVRYAI